MFAQKDLANWRGATPPHCRQITGRYVLLEPISFEKHGDDLWQAIRDPELHKYLMSGPYADRGACDAAIRAMIDSKERLYFAIIDKSTGEAQGLFSYMMICPEHGSIEIGHVIFGEKLKRTRKSTEAIFLMIDEAFSKLGYRRVEWTCNDNNAASRRAAVRFGFKFELVKRHDMVIKQANRDDAWFSIIDGEWPQLRKAYVAWLEPENFDDDGAEKRKLGDFIKQFSNA